ncbi:MAG: hypothetical protein GC162_06890 [Planctomycetes bacterium]|nr:hypothetical protein [Planctomycetota bacterium]
MHRLIPAVVMLLFTAALRAGAPAPAPIAPPGDLKAEPIAPTAVKLMWAKPAAEVRGVQIERLLEGETKWRAVAELPVEVTTYESVGLLGGVRCEHRISSIDDHGKAGEPAAFPTVTTTQPGDTDFGTVFTDPVPGFERASEGDMIDLRDGSLLFAYGQWPTYSDDAQGVRLGMRRSTDGGKTWTEPVALMSDPKYDLYHPSLARLGNGELGLSYTKRLPAEPRQQKGEKAFRWSSDEGKTWSDEVLISDGDWQFYQTSAVDRLLVTSSGRLVHPVSRRRIQSKPYLIGTLIYTSDDHGRTWQRRTPDPIEEKRRGMFHEADVVEYAPGKLLMLGRTMAGRFYESRSEDNGDSWSEGVPSNIPSAVAPPKLLRDPADGSILLVWNPYVGGGDTHALGPRLILGMWRSRDGGRTWSGYRQLVYKPDLITTARNGYTGFCYASGLFVGDTLHLTFTDYFATDPKVIRIRYLPMHVDP